MALRSFPTFNISARPSQRRLFPKINKMRISPLILSAPAYELHYEGTLTLRTPDLRSTERELTWAEAYAMAVAGEIEALATSAGRVKCFRRLAPNERPEMPTAAAQADAKSRGHLPVAALRCYYEEQVGPYLVGTLGKARSARVKEADQPSATRSFGIVPWSDRDGFNPNRFNPDMVSRPKLAAPLQPPVRA